MSKAEYIKGPWFVFRNWPRDSGPTYIAFDYDANTNDPMVARVGVDETTEADEARADLIAAAPELLAALESIVEGCKRSGIVLVEAEAAIAKAKGETE